MEAIVMFVMGIWFTYFAVLPAFIGLCIAGVIAEYNDESGFTALFLILAGISAFFVFGITLEMIALYSIAYFAIGLVWSFWRYKTFVQDSIDKMNIDYPDDKPALAGGRDARLERMKPTNNVDLIVYWIFVWPFSAIENLTGDLISIVSKLVTTTFNGIYNKIYTSAVGAYVEK